MNKMAQIAAQAGVTQSELADKLGVTRAAVCHWGRRRIPAERVLEIERITGVSRHILRPDIYGAPADVAA